MVGVTEIGQEVDRPAGPERLDRKARIGVERVQEETRCHDIDPPGAIDLRVGHTLAVVLPHRIGPALGGRLAERPEGLAGRGVERHHGSTLSRHPEQLALGVDRGRSQDVVDTRSEVIASPDPGHLEFLEVLGVDLIEWCVAGTPGIGTPVTPSTVLGQCREGERNLVGN